jgi:hypothetical protein
MMGEAAGVAASIAQSAQQAVWDISPTKLQTELKKNDIETI